MKTKTYLLVLILAFSLTISNTSAEINLGNSLEWVCTSSDLIVRGTITSVDMKGKQVVCSFEVSEGLFGELKSTAIEFTYASNQAQNDKVKRMMTGSREVLVFLINKNKEEKKAPIEYSPVHDQNSGFFYIIDLSEPGKLLMSAKDLKILKTNAEVIKYTKDFIVQLKNFLEKKKKKKFKKYMLELSKDSEVFQELYSGSSCYLYVPDVFFPNAKEKM
ncbi:MAG: hypothetical protein A2275_11300 [Bacteroidetes bacterium RIFOXYA12_FULL_35_11]|nr:MAG: hypothetical protein A2X01_19245 [Bacteroidetes bacterium GWF2_35_48]OFY74425.1 MAG: hypothetical protein A2275_11300 [Bacteroidetes bacterium RIFOXYA12_FULL_35_11]OFY95925.1 MAG: hypothetical protein A2491_11525 [Bacteroidetes bacterium RIFOXYC12_FULL_35_7]HBX50697.1 hypothetical protein [Bacteroidales bacterium]